MAKNNRCFGCMEEKNGEQPCPHCGYELLPLDVTSLYISPGSILDGKYLVGRVLGQGGFGITYLAWDLNLNLKLAIKEYLPLDMASRVTGQATVSVYKKGLAGSFQYGLEKYLEEARTLARFAGHPSIVWVRDFFKANGTAYIVMEYVEGASLKEYLRTIKEPLSFEQALTIFMPVLDALKEVHAEGILHRDISPDNILISSRGRVVLIDFGAARQAVGEQSRSLSVIMKAGFSPEEQYHSKGKQGPWTDIYAVAASIYCAITGTVPPESLSRLSEDSLIPPSQLGFASEPLFEEALMKAPAVRASDRYQSVAEFQEALFVLQPDALEEGFPSAQSKPIKQKQVEKLKKGPYCSEDIKAAAVFCRYCRMSLADVKPKVIEKSSEQKQPGFNKKDIGSPFRAKSRLIRYSGLALLAVILLYVVTTFFDSDFGLDRSTGVAALGADYYIDYENGTIPLYDLPIGARVVDPSWEWEFRTGDNYSGSGEVKPVTWIIVAQDHYEGMEPHVTLLSEELIGRHAFDNSTNRSHAYVQYGYNHWGESGTHSSADRDLRPWLNSTGIHSGEGFYRAFSESFKRAVLVTTVPNREWQNGSAYSTSDHVFIPSTTEVGDSDHDWTYRVGSVYAYFSGAGDRKRVALLGGEARLYWTRSPASGGGFNVRIVFSAGDFLNYNAYYAYDGVRPAMNLKSEIFVSEIKN